ncbi:MAG: type II toxin-antitoxin system HipA family toxin YjjJ [Pseudomonadota bacterium]
MASKGKYQANLIRLLQTPTDSAALITALSISQPTLSRHLRTVPDLVTFGAARARKYALRRAVPGVIAPISLSWVTEDGELASVGSLHILQNGWYALTKSDSNEFTIYQGLPFFLRDLRPQGFLGRIEPTRNPDLGLPLDILHWTDDHTLKYLARRSEHAAGNLILGNASYARFLESIHTGPKPYVTIDELPHRYPELAESAMRGDPPGSSAGGEQPKFTCAIQREQGTPTEHVIVKFSPSMNSPSGRRWADLLVCEHLALETLSKNMLPAARTSVMEHSERMFLEVVRFDRIGAIGRAPMVTYAGLDGDLGMLDESWSAVADVLVSQKMLSRADADLVEILDLFGALIGNVDKHHGNIAVAWGFKEPFRLLPAYDMLPMLYRPNAHGEIVPRQWQATSTQRLQLRHLQLCFELACQFWRSVAANDLISQDFKAVAAAHRAAIEIMNPKPRSIG